MLKKELKKELNETKFILSYARYELKEKDKEIERLNNKVEELMDLYTSEREVKEDYKSIIKEVREYIEDNTYKANETEYMDLTGIEELLEILDKGGK